MNFDKKDEDSSGIFHLDKTQVFQDARAFNASPIQPKKCRILLTKIKCTVRLPGGVLTNRSIRQWGGMEYEGGDRLVLWDYKAVST
jgi:hypothetical protein